MQGFAVSVNKPRPRAQSDDPAMATLKSIRRRIASVKSTQQITRAMKLVAAARLRRAQEALINARPYHEALKRVADSLLLSAPELAGAAAKMRTRATLLIVVTADRGLDAAATTPIYPCRRRPARQIRSNGLMSQSSSRSAGRQLSISRGLKPADRR